MSSDLKTQFLNYMTVQRFSHHTKRSYLTGVKLLKKGSPIKGSVKKKNTSPMKKSFLFFLDTMFPTARCCFATFLAPVISFLSVCSSIYADPHQSPIRFKAIVL